MKRAFTAAELAALESCHPHLQLVLRDAREIVDYQLIQGHRNEADQNRAFREGKTKLMWPHGNHNSMPSLAADVAPRNFDVAALRAGASIDWSDLAAFGRLMGIMEACAWRRELQLRFGLDWDQDWRSVGPDPDESFLDAPHMELAKKPEGFLRA